MICVTEAYFHTVPIKVVADDEHKFGFFFENFQASAEKSKEYHTKLMADEALKAAEVLKFKQAGIEVLDDVLEVDPEDEEDEKEEDDEVPVDGVLLDD